MKKRPQTIIREFLDNYAAVTTASDVSAVADAYFETYIEASPSGVAAYKVDGDYRKQLKEKQAGLRSKLGFKAAAIHCRSIRQIAPNHFVVVAEWTMAFERDRKTFSSGFDITYVVRLADPGPVILAYVSHENEEDVMKRDGVL